MSLQLGTTGTAGEAPSGSASRSPLTLFVMLCLVFAVMVHAEPLAAAAAAAADLHLHPGVVTGVGLSVAALFNLVILKLNFLLARRPAAAGPTTPSAPIASASRSPVALFMVLCLLIGAALHAEQLAAAAKEYQIHPAVVVGFVLAASALFHLLILSIHKSLARHQAEDEPKQLRRRRGRVPLLPFIVLALIIPTAASAEKVLAADAADLPQEASVWALLALAVSFNIAIGSLYCFIIAGPPPPAPTGAEPLSWSKASGAIISFIVAATAVLVLYMLLASGGASGAIAARS
ncbi:unnamed protein product [Urochloa decumbens]|uniref:Uncharacterized protein n=1 Tax=Urochloa decumbens TaxID=240449 RepID=A0ABC9EVS7_9POAL